MKAHLSELRQALHWDEINWRSLAWLVAGLGLLGLWLVLWLGQTVVSKAQPRRVVDSDTSKALPKEPLGNIKLGALTNEVPELDLTTGQSSSSGARAPEFRGGDFVKAQASSWTVQLMTVSEESVIRDYLTHRPDRSQFYYLRTLDGRSERYVLVYGIFNTVQTAMGAISSQNFGLPNSIKPTPVKFASFVADVAPDQGSNVRMTSGVAPVRQVKLRTVPVPADNPLDRPPAASPAERDKPRRPKPSESREPSDDQLGDLARQVENDAARARAPERSKPVEDGFADVPDAPPPESAPLPSEVAPAADPFAAP